MDTVSAFGVAAGVAQFVDLAVDVAFSLSQYFQSVQHAPKLSRELQQEALLVSLVLEKLRSQLVTSHNVGTTRLTGVLNDSIMEFEKAMRDIASRVLVKEGDLMKRLKWPFTERENREYFSKLERYKNTFTLALTTVQRYIIHSQRN